MIRLLSVAAFRFPASAPVDLLLLAVSLAVLFLILDRFLHPRSRAGRGLLGILLVGIFLLAAGMLLARPGRRPTVSGRPAVQKPVSALPPVQLLRLGAALLPDGFLPGPNGGYWVLLLPRRGGAEVRMVNPAGALGKARSLPGVPTAVAAAPDGSALAALPAAPGAEILRITGGGMKVTPLPRIVSKVEALLSEPTGIWLGYRSFDGRTAVGLFKGGVLSETATVPGAGVWELAGGAGRLLVLGSAGTLYEKVLGGLKPLPLPAGVRAESLRMYDGEPAVLGYRAGSAAPLRLLRLSRGVWSSLAFGSAGDTPGELGAGDGRLLFSFSAGDRPGFGEIVGVKPRLRVFDLMSQGIAGGGGEVYPAADGGFWGAVPSSGVLIRGRLWSQGRSPSGK